MKKLFLATIITLLAAAQELAACYYEFGYQHTFREISYFYIAGINAPDNYCTDMKYEVTTETGEDGAYFYHDSIQYTINGPLSVDPPLTVYVGNFSFPLKQLSFGEYYQVSLSVYNIELQISKDLENWETVGSRKVNPFSARKGLFFGAYSIGRNHIPVYGGTYYLRLFIWTEFTTEIFIQSDYDYGLGDGILCNYPSGHYDSLPNVPTEKTTGKIMFATRTETNNHLSYNVYNPLCGENFYYYKHHAQIIKLTVSGNWRPVHE